MFYYDIYFLFYITFLILIISIPFIKKYLHKKIFHKSYKKEIKFDEFDDIDKVLQQEKHEKEQMLIDLEILEKVSDIAYQKASRIDTPAAYEQARREIEQAKKDIKSFRLLDSVEVEEDKIYEGPAITAIKENEDNFDTELFKKWCMGIFKCIKSGTKKELEAVKYFINENMYNRLIHQMEQFEKDGLEFITENLLIKDCNFVDYSNWLEKEEIKISIKAKMKEYILQKSTNKILKGSNKKSYEKEIIMTFLKHNVEEEQGFISNCLNCGGPLTQTELGKCKYCNTLVFPIRYNWTLTKFETM